MMTLADFNKYPMMIGEWEIDKTPCITSSHYKFSCTNIKDGTRGEVYLDPRDMIETNIPLGQLIFYELKKQLRAITSEEGEK